MVTQITVIKQASLCAQTVRHLTDTILSRRVLPGQFLPPEAALCKQFEVSRSTVREAITVLETRGLVQRQHGVGILVTDHSQAAAVSSLNLLLQMRKTTLRDLVEARIGLECLIAFLAAGHATDAEVGALQAAIAPMRHPGSTEEQYVQADLTFHLRLAEASHNAVYVVLVDAVRELLLESIRATYHLDGHTERRLRDHTQILAAVRARDPHAAHAAMRDHLHSTEAMLRQLGLLTGTAITVPTLAGEMG